MEVRLYQVGKFFKYNGIKLFTVHHIPHAFNCRIQLLGAVIKFGSSNYFSLQQLVYTISYKFYSVLCVKWSSILKSSNISFTLLSNCLSGCFFFQKGLSRNQYFLHLGCCLAVPLATSTANIPSASLISLIPICLVSPASLLIDSERSEYAFIDLPLLPGLLYE